MYFQYTELTRQLTARPASIQFMDRLVGPVHKAYLHFEQRTSLEPEKSEQDSDEVIEYLPDGKVAYTRHVRRTGKYYNRAINRSFEQRYFYAETGKLNKVITEFAETDFNGDLNEKVYNTDVELFEYDAAGRICRRVAEGKEMHQDYIYDNQDRLSELKKWQNNEVYEHSKFEYDQSNRVIRIEEYAHPYVEYWEEKPEKGTPLPLRLTKTLSYKTLDDNLFECEIVTHNHEDETKGREVHLFNKSNELASITKFNTVDRQTDQMTYSISHDEFGNVVLLTIFSRYSVKGYDDTFRTAKFVRKIEYR